MLASSPVTASFKASKQRSAILLKIGLIILFLVVAFIMVLVGVGFFISTLYLYLLALVHSSILATLFCGAAFFVIAILLLLMAVLIKSQLFKIKAPKLKAKIEAVQEDPAGEALNLVHHYPFRSALVAISSGFLLGFFPKLRDKVIDGVVTYAKTGSIAESLKSLKSDEED